MNKTCQDVVNATVKTHHKKLQDLTKNEVLPLRNNEVIIHICQTTAYQIMKQVY